MNHLVPHLLIIKDLNTGLVNITIAWQSKKKDPTNHHHQQQKKTMGKRAQEMHMKSDIAGYLTPK